MHPDANQSQTDILQVLRKSGFPPQTPAQEKLASLLLKGRDVVVELARDSDPTPSFVLPLILGLRGSGLAPHALLLMPNVQEVGKITQAINRFTRVVRDAPAFVPLGEIEDARREQRRLEKGATIVAGTTERVIDHIRRGTLSVAELETVVVKEPEGEAAGDFARDVQFIFARLSARHQTILLSAASADHESELAKLLRHPVLVTAGSGEAGLPEKEQLAFEASPGDKIQTLARILLGRKIQSALVLCGPRTDPQVIARALRDRLVRATAWPQGQPGGPPPHQRARASRNGGDKASLLAALSRGEVDVVVGSSLPEGFSPTHVVYFDPPTGSRPVRWTSNIIALVDRGQEKEISRLQEAIGVTPKKEDLPTDNEVVVGSIDRVLRILKDDKEKAELARLRSLIRRQVPLFQRSLFMAYLLKSLLPPSVRPEGIRQGQEASGRSAPSPEPSPALAGKPARGRFGRSVEAPRPPAESAQGFTQLFVSIGRNRRVFARELAELFTEKLQLGSHELGSVRVFDKYSFVDINPARADEAITKLSGSEVKGRTITVNFAKKKEEKEQR